MIQQYSDNPSGSPVDVQCDKNCQVLSGRLWKTTLSAIHDSIVFIDEGNEFVASDAFSEAIAKTDNYYVIVTRESLPNLPYSVEEIYGIHEAGKYGTLRQTYNEFYRIYGKDVYNGTLKPALLITEDSNSGFQFFHEVCEKAAIHCKSAGGKSNMFQTTLDESGFVLLIADGAAFGPEMDRMMKLIESRDDIALYLPESFEWMILKADLFDNADLKKMLESPSDFIESSRYFSWEKFFTDCLIQISNKTYLQYSKKTINRNYLNEKIMNKILSIAPMINLSVK